MKYLSICSGIESVSVAWDGLGFECLGVSEIDDFRTAVLDYHYPDIHNFGDFTKIEKKDLPQQPDIIVGGTPCATFSVAGLREGIRSDRGNLALEFILLAERVKPKWILWENVPGVLSSNGGKDLGAFLGALGECGYGFSYRVLNTEFVRTPRYPRALPQRRRRVFVVGCLGDWRSTAKVLFDGETMSGNPPPSRKARTQRFTQESERDSGSPDQQSVKTMRQIRSDAYVEDDVAGTIAARDYKSATDLVIMTDSHSGSNGKPWNTDGVSWALTAHDRYTVVNTQVPRNKIVRRLTPVECERLQGFPDNYTQVPYLGKEKEQCPISKRYEACGRAMSINVMEWLGSRIMKVHSEV